MVGTGFEFYPWRFLVIFETSFVNLVGLYLRFSVFLSGDHSKVIIKPCLLRSVIQ